MGANVSSEGEHSPSSSSEVSQVSSQSVSQVAKPIPAKLASTVSSYCKSFGKDKVIFLTKDDWDTVPVGLPDSFVDSLGEEEDNGPRGVINAKTGEINWGCPCLGNLPYGPCAMPFREAFSCFHYSVAEPKGSDCIDKFRRMTECMQHYPNLYPSDRDDDEDEHAEDDAFSTMDKAEEQAQQESRPKQRTGARSLKN